MASDTHLIHGALLAPIGSWRTPGPRQLATIVHDRTVVRRLLNSDSLPDILCGRLVYNSAGDRRVSDAEGVCAVDKDDPDAKNDCYGSGCADMNDDVDAVLAVDFEYFLCRNWRNRRPFVVKL